MLVTPQGLHNNDTVAPSATSDRSDLERGSGGCGGASRMSWKALHAMRGALPWCRDTTGANLGGALQKFILNWGSALHARWSGTRLCAAKEKCRMRTVRQRLQLMAW